MSSNNNHQPKKHCLKILRVQIFKSIRRICLSILCIFMKSRKYFEMWEMNDERILNSLAMGFDLALNSGPLCEETIIGI